ncbi:MAG: transporter [Pontixanthobacter sp.]
MRRLTWICAALLAWGQADVAAAQDAPSQTMQQQLDRAMTMIAAQQEQLDRQAAQIEKLLEDQSHATVATANPPNGDPRTGGAPVGLPRAGHELERVGEAPAEADRPIELAVLDNQGSVVTRKGQISADLQFDYTRSDRNRAVFRGIELVDAVLVGVFDINESRQDVLTASAALRYGLTDRLEVGVKLPFVHRADTSIVAPIAGSTNNDPAATIDNSVDGTGIGDVELSARYQLIDGGNGSPFVIANLQGVIPTGSDPFAVPRDELGRATQAATGAGFFGITPSLTAILPSDPVVLFGTLGYTFNLGEDVDTAIPPVRIEHVDPGDAISASGGIGISFNDRTTLNLGYAHAWAFGTTTRTSLLDPGPGDDPFTISTSRDLQIGRFLFGVTHRVNPSTSINWSVEVGATDDAADVRSSLRIPLTF